MSFNVFFTEIERIQLASVRGEHLVTIQLKNHTLPGQQKCFLFECHCLNDFAACLEFHCPSLATPCPRDDIRSQEVTSPHSKTFAFIDLFIVFNLSLALVQYVYMKVAGDFPYNAFLAGFFCTLGTATLSACLRMAIESKSEKSEEKAFIEYMALCLLLYLVSLNYLG